MTQEQVVRLAIWVVVVVTIALLVGAGLTVREIVMALK